MSIGIFKSKQCKLAPTVTVLGTYNFSCTNVRAKLFYVHANIKFVEPWKPKQILTLLRRNKITKYFQPISLLSVPVTCKEELPVKLFNCITVANDYNFCHLLLESVDNEIPVTFELIAPSEKTTETSGRPTLSTPHK